MSATTEASAAPLGWAHVPHDLTFRKTLTNERARAESTGWRSTAGRMPAPRLLSQIPGGDRQTLVFEDVFAQGRCRRLLADVITLADAEPDQAENVTDLINAVCDSWLASWARTGTQTALNDCVPTLYATRLRWGGRLDFWYAHTKLPTTVVTGTGIYRLDIPEVLDQLRAVLAPASRWPAALTQGDPTEPNIAQPLCWLDFEHAGRNALAGEAANLLWYLMAMGGWLVPTYQPITYTHTLRYPGYGATAPAITYWRSQSDRVTIDFTLGAAPGRRAALKTLITRLHTDLGSRLAPPGVSLRSALAPWLAARILGVIPLTTMRSCDAAICLAKLGQTLDSHISVEDFAIPPVEPRCTRTRSR